MSLEKQVEHLQKVIDAQKNDPAFVREQARFDFDVASPDEQRIPVESHLRLNIGTGNADLAVVPAGTPLVFAPVRRRRPFAVCGQHAAGNRGGPRAVRLHVSTTIGHRELASDHA